MPARTLAEACQITIRVDKGIPIPPPPKPRGRQGSSKAIYPWRDMEIGDSFLFPPELGRSAHAAIIQAHRLTNMMFTLRRVEGDLWRCWRVA